MPGLALTVGTTGGPNEVAPGLAVKSEESGLLGWEELAWAAPSFWGTLEPGD